MTSPTWHFISAALAIALCVVGTSSARAQLEFTEILFNATANPETPWEWVEVRNSSAGPLDLDGYVLDDDDQDPLFEANILSANGNTIVPAGGVAVLYNGEALDFTPDRFLDAWGAGINVIGVTSFPQLSNGGDRVGLWSNLTDYGAMDFTAAIADINYDVENGFPPDSNGRSLAWGGSGSLTEGANWVVSEAGVLGAISSSQTMRTLALNSPDDFGNPGVQTSIGSPPSGLLITEIMYNPASPGEIGGTGDAGFEFVEVLNNTSATIDFAAQNYVFDDAAGANLETANVTSGSVTPGETAVLFDSSLLTAANMETVWGAGNYIPVSDWSALNNGGDTAALWGSLADYATDSAGEMRVIDNAAVAVVYDDDPEFGWPQDNGDGSIFLQDLSADPGLGDSWLLSEDGDGFSFPANVIEQIAVDHPGMEVGSPGSVPVGMMTVAGDMNGDGAVNFGDLSPFTVALTDPTAYEAMFPDVDRVAACDVSGSGSCDFGDLSPFVDLLTGGEGSAQGTAVPEPTGMMLLLLGMAALTTTARVRN